MNSVFRAIFLLKSMSVGVMMPVLSLLIIARGADLGSLGLVIGSYSLTVILLEFPSGVFCDIFGRKRTFLVSCIVMIASLLLLLLGGDGLGILLGAYVLQGAGRAFSSGSLDALAIDRSQEAGGDAAVAATSGELGLLESTGIAAGSILGGVLGGFGTAYSANLIVKLAFDAAVLALAALGVREQLPDRCRRISPAGKITERFLSQMKDSLRFAWDSMPVRVLMCLVFLTGTGMMTVEIYWQPGFQAVLGREITWIFGLVSFLGFGFTAASSHLAGRLLKSRSDESGNRWWRLFFLAKLLVGAAVMILGIWKSPVLFAAGYCLIYFLHGSGSVMENALLSRYTPNEKRASVMSLLSLVFQMGCLTASGAAGVILSRSSLAGLWLLAGFVLCAGGLGLGAVWSARR